MQRYGEPSGLFADEVGLLRGGRSAPRSAAEAPVGIVSLKTTTMP
ncbi:hypothetical protein ABZY81_40755 [Streptomyces sp. NPDC006514]